MMMIRIPFANVDILPYEATGLIHQVKIISRKDVRVIVDINTKDP